MVDRADLSLEESRMVDPVVSENSKKKRKPSRMGQILSVKCPLCDLQIPSSAAKNLWTHLQFAHKVWTWQTVCYKCGRRLSQTALLAHLHSHKETPPYECLYCGHNCDTEEDMMNHLKDAHNADEPHVECRLCGILLNHRHLQSHLQKQHGIKIETNAGENTDEGSSHGEDESAEKENVEQFEAAGFTDISEQELTLPNVAGQSKNVDAAIGNAVAVYNGEVAVYVPPGHGEANVLGYQPETEEFILADPDYTNQTLVCEFDLRLSDAIVARSLDGRRWLEWVLNVPFLGPQRND